MINVLCRVLLTLSFLSSPVFAETVEELLAEIVAIQGANPENEARLLSLYDHPDEGVRNSARTRMAQILYSSGRLAEAEDTLNEHMLRFDEFTPKYKIEALLVWSMFEFRRNNFVAAEEYGKRALKIAKTLHPVLVPDTQLAIGQSLSRQQKWLEAIDVFEQAEAAYTEQNKLSGIFNANNSLGVLYQGLGDLAKALEYLQKSREAVEKLGHKSRRATVYYNLGDVYLSSKEPDRALRYYEQALVIDKELGNIGDIAFDYTGIGSAYMEMEAYTEALQSNQLAIQNLLRIDAPQELSRAYLQQARIYRRQDDTENLFTSLELAQQHAFISDSIYQKMSVNIEFGMYHLNQRDFSKAEQTLKQALLIADDLELDKDRLKIHSSLAENYQQTRQFEKAFYHSNQSVQLQNKLSDSDQREKTEKYKRDVNLLEEKLKVSQLKQQQIQKDQELQIQKNLQQRLYLVSIGVVLFFSAGMFVFWQRRRLSMLKIKLYEDTLRQKQQLFADVSHELRTPLTSLKLQIESLEHNLVSDVQAGYKDLNTKVSEINRLITDIYQMAKADSLSLELDKQDYELNMAFTHWEKDWRETLTNKGFEFSSTLELGDAKLRMDADRIKQVIDNLLSNSAFYTDKPGKIHLHAAYKNKQLFVTIEDTAPTVDKDKLEDIFSRLYRVETSRSRQTGGSGLGLAICRSLIEAHGGEIHAEQSKLGGLLVTFRI
jgi:signal transduction histidine kinase/Tfp pilus assembly protein PilF